MSPSIYKKLQLSAVGMNVVFAIPCQREMSVRMFMIRREGVGMVRNKEVRIQGLGSGKRLKCGKIEQTLVRIK